LGIAIVWFAFPRVESYMNDMARRIEYKFQKAGLSL